MRCHRSSTVTPRQTERTTTVFAPTERDVCAHDPAVATAAGGGGAAFAGTHQRLAAPPDATDGGVHAPAGSSRDVCVVDPLLRLYDSWTMGYLYNMELQDEIQRLSATRAPEQQEVDAVVHRMRPDTVLGPLT